MVTKMAHGTMKLVEVKGSKAFAKRQARRYEDRGWMRVSAVRRGKTVTIVLAKDEGQE